MDLFVPAYKLKQRTCNDLGGAFKRWSNSVEYNRSFALGPTRLSQIPPPLHREPCWWLLPREAFFGNELQSPCLAHERNLSKK